MTRAREFTQAIRDALIREHAKGEFRKVTSVQCGVHPSMLARWLKRGLSDPDDEPYSTFAIDFLQVESNMRLELVNEARTTQDINRAKIVHWFLTRRFQQWQDGYVGSEDDGEAISILDQLSQKGGMTSEQRNQVVEDMLASPPKELLASLARTGWTRKELPPPKDEHVEAEEPSR